MRTGEKRIHYLKIIRQWSTYRKKRNVSKRKRKEFTTSLQLPLCHCAYLWRCTHMRSRETWPRIVFKNSACVLKHLMHMRWLQRKTVQSNVAAPFISKQKMQIHFAMWRIRCQSRSIDITYKYKNSTITKAIMMRRDKTINSALTLSNDSWQTAGDLLNYELTTGLQK